MFDKWNNPVSTFYQIICEKYKIAYRQYNFECIKIVDKGETQEGIRKISFIIDLGYCKWYSSSAGCTMCCISNRNKCLLDEDNILSLINNEIDKINHIIEIDIYIGGSFLDKKQVSEKLSLGILKLLAGEDKIKKITIESRPEFINQYSIANINKIENNNKINIAIGLESISDWTRTICINKGFTYTEFEEAANLIHSDRLIIYTLLKPILLSEKEAFWDTYYTIRILEDKFNPRKIVLMPCNVQLGTINWIFWKSHLYRPPWYWTILLLKNIFKNSQLSVGGFSFHPKPVDEIRNCNNCNNKMRNIIQYENIYKYQDVSCDCLVNWKNKMISKQENIYTFKRRIATTFIKIANNLKIDHKLTNNAINYAIDRKIPKYLFSDVPNNLFNM